MSLEEELEMKAKKKRKKVPFAATWMDLEIIILSEVRKRKTNTI